MKTLFGIFLMLFGVATGLYVGVWLCFVGGIWDLVEFAIQVIDKEALSKGLLGFGILKIILASFLGYVAGIIPFFTGLTMLGYQPRSNRSRRKW